MPKYCTQCGTALQAETRFCGNCGVQAAPGTIEDGLSEPAIRPNSSVESAAEEVQEPAAVIETIGLDHWSSGDTYAAELAESVSIAKIRSAANVLLQGAAFFTIYLVLAIPTYILPWLGSNSTFVNGVSAVGGAGMFPLFYIHFTFLYGLCAIAWLRGILIGRQWLVVFPIFATIFDLSPGFNWIPLVPTVFHILTVSLGVSRSPSEESPPDLGSRAVLALVGLGLLALLTTYKMVTYKSATDSALAHLSQTVNPPNFQPAYQPPSESSLASENLVVVPAPQIQQPTVDRVTFASVAGANNSPWVEQDSPPPGPLSMGVKWYYTGARVSQPFNCSNDNAVQYGTLVYEKGWVSCTWNHVESGSHELRLMVDGRLTDYRSVIVPSALPIAVDSHCPPFDTEKHVCTLTRPTKIVEAQGFQAGYTYCFTPSSDSFSRVQVIAQDGHLIDFDANLSITASGYIITPKINGQKVRYWLDADRSCV